MYNSSFLSQTHIYFHKTRRIAKRERFWKFIAFSVIISFIVSGVVGSEMFKTYEGTKSGFFAITSAAIWIGIFNSIQVVCREHEIIHAECRSGMKISAYITANAIWQLILCLIQSLLLFGISLIFIDYNSEGVLFGFAAAEYFITIFLLTFGGDLMGLMISAIAGTPTTAMTIMPFVLIIQLIMGGVLFDLSGWSEIISYITFSKWGMSAFGSTADLNSSSLPLTISEAFPNVHRLELESCYEHIASNVITGWLWCIGITIVCYLISIIVLKVRNKDA